MEKLTQGDYFFEQVMANPDILGKTFENLSMVESSENNTHTDSETITPEKYLKENNEKMTPREYLRTVVIPAKLDWFSACAEGSEEVGRLKREYERKYAFNKMLFFIGFRDCHHLKVKSGVVKDPSSLKDKTCYGCIICGQNERALACEEPHEEKEEDGFIKDIIKEYYESPYYFDNFSDKDKNEPLGLQNIGAKPTTLNFQFCYDPNLSEDERWKKSYEKACEIYAELASQNLSKDDIEEELQSALDRIRYSFPEESNIVGQQNPDLDHGQRSRTEIITE